MLNSFSETVAQKIIAFRHPILLLCLGLAIGVGFSGTKGLMVVQHEIASPFFASHDIIRTLAAVLFSLLIFVTPFLQSIVGTMAVLLVAALSSFFTLGIFGWLGFELHSNAALAPALIMALAVADAVHLLATMRYHTDKKQSRSEAFTRAVKISIYPILITSLTSALGFLGFILQSDQNLQNIGIIGMTGVIIAFVFSIVLLPAIMTIWPMHIRKNHDKIAPNWAKALFTRTLNTGNKVCLIDIAFIAFCIYGITLIQDMPGAIFDQYSMMFILGISILVGISFKNILFGIISAAYGGACILAAYTAMHVFGIDMPNLPLITTIMGFGIIIDNKTHIFMKFKYAKTVKKMRPREATDYAYFTVGHELISISALLILSFLSFYKSPETLMTQIASFMLFVLSFNLLIDFVMLPKLLQSTQDTEKS